jgi:hypothetical protein
MEPASWGAPDAHPLVSSTPPVTPSTARRGADTSPGAGPDAALSGTSGPPEPAERVEQPAKLVRIGSMVKQLLEEVRTAPLDGAGRDRLRSIQAASVEELRDGLAPELSAELDRLARPLAEEPPPSVAELRIAQAQLVGWVEGVFQGLQITLLLEQIEARAQLEGLRSGTTGRQPEFPAGGGTYL